MFKKTLFAFCFLSSLAVWAEDIYETNIPNAYVKNVRCADSGGYRVEFNIVNKSDTRIHTIQMILQDPAGDPIDKASHSMKSYLEPQTGMSWGFYLKNCNAILKTHKLIFSVKGS